MSDVDPQVLRHAKAHLLVDDVDRPVLSADQQHHVVEVLRVRERDTVTVTDGAGRWRPGVVASGVFDATAEPVWSSRPGPEVTVGFALPKGDRPEWIVQKLTELGIARIWLLHADRSVVRWTAERGARRIEKLQRTTREALQQSRGVWLPKLEGPMDVDAVLASSFVAEPGGPPLVGRNGDTARIDTVLVGPEGGWTTDEIQAAQGVVALGSTVLRVETAALVAGVQLLQRGSA